MNYTQEQLEEIWFNVKTKKDFMEQVGIMNRDYRACDRLLKKFNINKEDIGKNLVNSSKKIKPVNNLIGQKFGQIEVVEIDTKKSQKYNRTYYKCYCNICNSYFVKRVDDISRHDWNNGCGCRQKINKRLKQSIDLTGCVFGKLTVIEIDKEETAKHKENIYWKCQCSCGNIVSICTSSLKYGNTLSCGCYNKERIRETKMKNLSGQTFGKLTVIELDEEQMKKAKAGERYNSNAYWKCKCSCGNIVSVIGTDLCKGKTSSCGCIKSKGELLIKEFLIKNNICFQSQYYFPDLKGVVSYLKFDFAIFRNNKIFTLIEFQGQQHYKPIDYFGGEEVFNKQQFYDQKKRDYCKNKNIKLLEIPYYKIDNIEEILGKFLKRGDFMPIGDV